MKVNKWMILVLFPWIIGYDTQVHCWEPLQSCVFRQYLTKSWTMFDCTHYNYTLVDRGRHTCKRELRRDGAPCRRSSTACYERKRASTLTHPRTFCSAIGSSSVVTIGLYFWLLRYFRYFFLLIGLFLVDAFIWKIVF